MRYAGSRTLPVRLLEKDGKTPCILLGFGCVILLKEWAFLHFPT